MRCERFDKLIHLFWDGRVNQSEEKKLKKHLSECKRCQKKLSLLESVEGKAKKIKIKQPPQEYWDSFSTRVRKKIFEHKERSPVFGLKKALESIFSFSPLKIKVAAGVISVLLVFIIGKLYMDYQKQQILPSKTVIKTTESPQLDIMEIKKEEGFSVEEGERRIGTISEKAKMEIKPTPSDQQEKKTISPKRTGDEKEVLLKEKKTPSIPEVAKEKPVPAYAPALEDQIPTKTETPSEQQFIAPETKSPGAGVGGEVEEKAEIKTAGPKKKVQKAEEIPQKGEAEQLVTKDISLPPPTRGFRPYSAMDHYMVNEKMLQKIEEDDTLMQVDELRRTIQVWKAYIEENPTDSLTNEGYLQVATCYYLLAKLSQDTTVISEGSKLLKKYLDDQIKDPTVKDNLSDRLKKIEALRER